MDELNEDAKKNIDQLFKNALNQKKGPTMANEGKPPSEVFKNIFAPKTPPKDASPPTAAPTDLGRNMFPPKKPEAPVEKDDLVEEIEKRLQAKESGGGTAEESSDLFSQAPAAETFKNVFPAQDTLNMTPKTPAKESLKDVFQKGTPQKPNQPAAEATQQATKPATPTASVFKDVFQQAPSAPKKPAAETVQKEPAEDTTKVPLSDVMKEAKDKGTIDKETYDAAIQKIVKSNIEGNTLVGGFKVVQRGAKSEIVLDEGAIEIPAGSKVEVIKKGGEISIIVKKGEGSVTFEGDVDSIDKLTDESRGDKKTAASKPNLGSNQSWLEGYEDDASGNAASEIKDELDLTDLRKEFRQKKKKEEAEAEEAKASAEGEEEAEISLFDRIFKRIKKTTEENPQEKLKRLSLENLSRVKGVGDERKALVGIAYVLKEFLEVKYEIPHELTYTDLIREIRARQMNNDTRNKLITFFKNTTLMVYANGPKADSFQRAYGMAERAIKELS
jgi:hypothetical protein